MKFLASGILAGTKISHQAVAALLFLTLLSTRHLVWLFSALGTSLPYISPYKDTPLVKMSKSIDFSLWWNIALLWNFRTLCEVMFHNERRVEGWVKNSNAAAAWWLMASVSILVYYYLLFTATKIKLFVSRFLINLHYLKNAI